tara:strand:- start:398 stop:601 length:204 start_codon:yes stop_codon:yes gene_type:complete
MNYYLTNKHTNTQSAIARPTMKTLIKDLVKTQAVKTEKHAEDAILIFFTTTGSIAFITIAVIIDCIF